MPSTARMRYALNAACPLRRRQTRLRLEDFVLRIEQIEQRALANLVLLVVSVTHLLRVS